MSKELLLAGFVESKVVNQAGLQMASECHSAFVPLHVEEHEIDRDEDSTSVAM